MCAARSDDTTHAPLRTSDVDTSRPLPVRARSNSAAPTAATSEIAAVWSPMPGRSTGGSTPGPTSAAATPARDQNAPMS